MSFTVKIAEYDDMRDAAAVEAVVFPHHQYVADAWNHFMTTEGQMILVYEGSRAVGIGHLQVLPDRTGWLEALRVLPEYQGQGAGKLIYEEWLKFAGEHQLKALGMFTGIANAKSAGLADRYGLHSVVHHKEFVREMPGDAVHDPSLHFHRVNWIRALELFLPLKEAYHDLFAVNRTFYHVNEANLKAMADEGKCFEEPESGSFLICGTRFEHSSKLHVPMMGGDPDRCLAFAGDYARVIGMPKLVCTFAADNADLEAALIRAGFTLGDRLITKERVMR